MIKASFTVYGSHIEELTEEAFAQGVRFFRCLEDDLEMMELTASPVVVEQDRGPTRWRAHVVMCRSGDSDD